MTKTPTAGIVLDDETLEALADWADKYDLTLGATAELNEILDRAKQPKPTSGEVAECVRRLDSHIDLGRFPAYMDIRDTLLKAAQQCEVVEEMTHEEIRDYMYEHENVMWNIYFSKNFMKRFPHGLRIIDAKKGDV